jgi:hypothetical protein
MKKSAFLIMIVMLIIGSCVQKEVDEKLPLEGAWKLVYGYWPALGYEVTFPDQVQGYGTKLFTKEHFAFINRFNDEATLDTTDTFVDYYGWGTYELNGDRYKEHIELHSVDEYHDTLRMLMEIRNDTLIQKWPVDENWMLPEEYNHEKWIRLE